MYIHTYNVNRGHAVVGWVLLSFPPSPHCLPLSPGGYVLGGGLQYRRGMARRAMQQEAPRCAPEWRSLPPCLRALHLPNSLPPCRHHLSLATFVPTPSGSRYSWGAFPAQRGRSYYYYWLIPIIITCTSSMKATILNQCVSTLFRRPAKLGR